MTFLSRCSHRASAFTTDKSIVVSQILEFLVIFTVLMLFSLPPPLTPLPCLLVVAIISFGVAAAVVFLIFPGLILLSPKLTPLSSLSSVLEEVMVLAVVLITSA